MDMLRGKKKDRSFILLTLRGLQGTQFGQGAPSFVVGSFNMRFPAFNMTQEILTRQSSEGIVRVSSLFI